MTRLGFDFGTTNSAVAVYDGEELHMLITDKHNDNPYVTPSLIYIEREGEVTVGKKAAHTYLEGETGRPVLWRRQDAANLEMTVASFEGDPIEFFQTISVLVDEAANGRLLQSIKTALFNERYEGTHIFGKFYRIEELIALLLRHLKSAAETQLGEPCEKVLLGRPVRFSDNPAADSRAEAILFKAAHVAGFTDIKFQLEPVGVTHLLHRSSPQRETALVFDFGGGTLDLTIAQVGGDQPPEVLATRGVHVGGEDLDRRIMASLLPYFGGGDEGHLPPKIADRLLSWQTMPELSQPHYLRRINELKRRFTPEPYLALLTLVTHNLGFKLFQEIERVKCQLSTEQVATLRFDYDPIHIEERITRSRFERMISAELAQVEETIHQILQDAGFRPDDISIVLRTGGSSLVPAFYNLLCRVFGEDKQREIDPLVSVVGGFAVAAYEIEQQTVAEHVDSLITDPTSTPQPLNLYCIALNAPCYADRNFTVDRLPYRLNDLTAIQMLNADYESQDAKALQFNLKHPARVYIAYESTVQQLPYWLRDFTPEAMTIEVQDHYALNSRVMRVYSKVFPAGQVTLGGNQAAGYEGDVILNYFVLAEPVIDFS